MLIFYRIIFILIICLLIPFSYSDLKADKRVYVWTYEYLIMEKGKWELEYYNTLTTPDASTFKGKTTAEHQLELEFGMNDWFDFAIYQVFKQVPDGSLKYDKFKFRTRFKIGEKDKLFVNPLIYLEYQGKPDLSSHVIEAKLILSKDFDDFNLSINPIIEAEYKDEWEFEPSYSLGFTYSLAKLLNIGLEAKGSKSGNYIGPTISHGGHDMWFAIGTLFHVGKVEDGKPQTQIRMIIGIQ